MRRQTVSTPVLVAALLGAAPLGAQIIEPPPEAEILESRAFALSVAVRDLPPVPATTWPDREVPNKVPHDPADALTPADPRL